MNKLQRTLLQGTLLPLLLLQALAGNAAEHDQQDSTDMLLVGSAEFRYLFWRVYKAELYAPQAPFRHFESLPFVLRLHYQREFSSEQIVTETARQLEHIGVDDGARLEQWLQALAAILVDVRRGDVISLEVDEHGSSHFFFNEQKLGSIDDEIFSEYFSAIWLSDKSSNLSFTRQLRGES